MQIIGPSGSGKTLGGLILAYGMMNRKYPDMDEFDLWGKIGLIDTEHERALIYEGMSFQGVKIGQFWHSDLKKPYSLENYKNAMDSLVREGVEVIVIDSASHAWEGEGGVLDSHEMSAKRNKFQSWNDTNKDYYNPLVSLLTGEMHGVHIISTVRAKQDYTLQKNEHTEKVEIIKVGLKPVQRDSLEYEMQVVLRLDMDHKFQASKDNSTLFEGKYEPIKPEHGTLLFDWLERGVDIFKEKREAEEKAFKERQAKVEELKALVLDHGFEEWSNEMTSHPAVGDLMTTSQVMLDKFEQALLRLIAEKQKQEDN